MIALYDYYCCCCRSWLLVTIINIKIFCFVTQKSWPFVRNIPCNWEYIFHFDCDALVLSFRLISFVECLNFNFIKHWKNGAQKNKHGLHINGHKMVNGERCNYYNKKLILDLMKDSEEKWKNQNENRQHKMMMMKKKKKEEEKSRN